MDNKFLDLLNEKTENKYSYLRLENYKMDKVETTNTVSLHLTFIVPYEIYNDQEKFNVETKIEIENAIKDIVPQNVSLHIKYDKVLVSREVVIRHIADYIREKYLKLFDGKYIPRDIKVQIEGDTVFINIPVDKNILYYCENKGVKENLTGYLNSKYASKNEITFKGIEIKEDKEFKLNAPRKIVDDGIVEIEKGLPILGQVTPFAPIYISKYTKPCVDATVCGFVVSEEKKVAKTGRAYFKFSIKDPTGAVMNCIYFYRKNQKKCTIESMKEGQDVVVTGELVEDTFSKGLTMFVKSVSHCIIDVEKTQKKIHFMKKQIQKMNVAEPVPYIDENKDKKYTLFDEVPYLCPLLRDGEFTVFDLETTAQSNMDEQKIIEIGAVRIKNGFIESTFQTLVDPEEPIALLSQNLCHIDDDMVSDAPFIQDAIGPFIKYALNSTLVGQNIIHFDTPIVKREAEKYGYVLDNKQLDTLNMAREGILGLKSYSLSSLCDYFNVVNETPHRALSDALATAKIFIKLANLLKLEN